MLPFIMGLLSVFTSKVVVFFLTFTRALDTKAQTTVVLPRWFWNVPKIFPMDMSAILLRSLIINLSHDLLRCLMLSVLMKLLSFNILQSFLLIVLKLKSNCIFFFSSCIIMHTPRLGLRASEIAKSCWNSLWKSVSLCTICILNLVFRIFLFLLQHKIHFLGLLLLSASFPLYFSCSLLNISWR